jgi:chromosome segregation ATPase
VLVTDGTDYRAESANLAAKQLKERFGGRMKFVLVGICKAGEVADRLQTLGTFAGGDSLSLTSENDIPAGLASVREACDEVRRRRRLLQRRVEQQRGDLLTEQARLNSELARSNKEAEVLAREVRVLQKGNGDLTIDLEAKDDEVKSQAGQLHEQSHQLKTAQEGVLRLQSDIGGLTAKHERSVEELKAATSRIENVEQQNKKDQTEISTLKHKTDTDQGVIQQLEEKLTTFNNSWASSLVNHETPGAGVLLLLLPGSGGGGSAIATKLLSAKFGLLGTGLGDTRDELKTELHAQTKKAEEATKKIDQIFETTGQQFEKLREESGRQFDGITKATERKMQEVSHALSTTLTDVTGRLNHVEEVAASTHADVVERLAGVRTDSEKQSQDLKASLERNVDQLRGAVVEKVDTPVRLMVDSLKELENRLAACVNQAASRLDERLPATVAASLQASLAEARTQIEVVVTRASQFENSLPDQIRSTMQTELADLRSTIDSGREGVDQMKDALRQDVERTAGETIQRVSDASANLIGPECEQILEIRAEVVRHSQETRKSMARVSKNVDQIPERMKVTGKKISSVQLAVQSIRDQIERLRHQFESGMHDSERRQLKQVSREESRNSDRLHAASIRDEMILNLRNEFAELCSSLKEISPGLSVPLSRIEEKLQSIVHELDREHETAGSDPNWLAGLKTQLDEVAALAESLRNAAPEGEHQPGKASEQKADSRVETADIPLEEDHNSAKPEESQPTTPSAEESVEESRRSAETKKRNQWIRELRMLPGLGKKSAGVLIDSGVNTIRELSDLGAGQKAVLRELGGRLRDIGDWVKAARKVRLLHDHLDLGLKDAIKFVVTDTWPERFLQMPDSELAELSTEFPEILDWVRDSRSDVE